jgi:hypothetical protein
MFDIWDVKRFPGEIPLWYNKRVFIENARGEGGCLHERTMDTRPYECPYKPLTVRVRGLIVYLRAANFV